MFAVASVLVDKDRLDIEDVYALLKQEGIDVNRHTWRGLTLSVEQVRCPANGDVVVQIEDDETIVTEECHELADELESDGVAADQIRKIRACRLRVEILPFQEDATEAMYEGLLASGITTEVRADSTLENPRVARIADVIADAFDGLVFDHVENRVSG